MKFHEKIGNHNGEMDKLDQIFHAFMDFVFGGGLATEGMRSAVNGVFVRADIQINNQQREDHCNAKDLLGTFRFELWIRDKNMQHIFLECLAKWRDDVRKEFGIENKMFPSIVKSKRKNIFDIHI
jgi:hypothetical protein